MREFINRLRAERQRRQRARHLLGFLHIPKTAGTSLVQALTECFEPERVMPGEIVYDLSQRDAKQMRQEYDVCFGHVGMDVMAPVATQVVTLVREPTERIISLYNYWRSVPIESATVFEGGLIDPGVTLAKELSFRDFIECGHQRILNDIENGQTFQIARSNNDAGRLALKGQSMDAIFDICQANIATMAAAGVTDHMEQFERDLKRRAGVKIEVSRQNVTSSREVARDNLPDDLLHRIHGLNDLDYRLYEALRAV